MNSIKVWLTFLSTLLVATIVAACLDCSAFAQAGWLKCSWSYELNIDFQANRGSAATRLLGSANATQKGHIIEIGRINVFNAGGTLQGLVRDLGEIAWNFVYSGGQGGCNAAIPNLRKSLSIKVRKKYKFECPGIAASSAKQTRHSLQPCITINLGRHDVMVANSV